MDDELSIRISRLMSMCVGCGRCTDNCPSHRHGGCDPRAVMGGADGGIRDCIGCGECTRVCEHTDPTCVMLHMRSKALGSTVGELYRRTGFVRPVSDLSRDRLEPVWKDGDRLMTGCMVQSEAPYLAYAATVALDAMGIGCSALPGDACCTYPLPFRQMQDAERDAIRKGIGASADGRRIVTLCPGCDTELRRSGVDAVNLVNHVARHLDRVPVLDRELKLAIEPGCHYDTLHADMIRIVEAVGAEFVGNRHGCCGKKIPGVSEGLMKERQAEVAGADGIIVACPMCLTRYDSAPGGLPVMHIAELLALAAGDASALEYHRIGWDA
ncbi:MAG: (Fe-S)-binding protein [Euryarchaeota archaeon]|nr:(Fe-S)-binding protein [Euryarchaeota archaeon]